MLKKADGSLQQFLLDFNFQFSYKIYVLSILKLSFYLLSPSSIVKQSKWKKNHFLSIYSNQIMLFKKYDSKMK